MKKKKNKKEKERKKRNDKLGLNVSGRCRSLAEEPTENLRLYIEQTSLLIFTVPILYPFGYTVASLGRGLLCCTYISHCVCVSLCLGGVGRAEKVARSFLFLFR